MLVTSFSMDRLLVSEYGLGFGTDNRSIALLCLSCDGMLVCMLQSGQGQAALHRGAVWAGLQH